MAAKFQFLVAAILTCSIIAADVNPHASLIAGKRDLQFRHLQLPTGMTAKDVADAFEDALEEEEPLLKEEEAEAKADDAKDVTGLVHHTTVVQPHQSTAQWSLTAGAVTPMPTSTAAALDSALGGGWGSEFERDVTQLVIGLSKGGLGATPFGSSVSKINDIIQKDMMPKVLAAHTKDQEILDRLAKELGDCGQSKKDELAIALQMKGKYTGFSKDHKECRGEEAALYTENVECHAEWKMRKTEKELKCRAYSAVLKKYGDSNANSQIVTKGGSEGVETYVRRITQTICGSPIKCPTCKNGGGGSSGGRGGGMLDDLLKHKASCEKATHEFNEQTKKCKGLDKNWHNKRKSCNNIQDSMDGASCKWAIDTKDACEAYSECNSAKREAYEAARCIKGEHPTDCKVGVVKDEYERKPEWKGLKRMKCIIEAFGKGAITIDDITKCKNMNHTTDHLNIRYPTLPDVEACSVPLLYPNTAEYKVAEFTPLPTLAKGKMDANECTGVREISTSAAQGSPPSCKCTRVTMDGPYSGGAVVKCLNCIDVSKSTEKTSCPAGTKLFSPQSRQDWESFLKSAQPLRAPNWIIDITRPQNGCGGCTGYNMNTQTSQQLSWVTKDGSPWWLRSTKYNEPNGDYHANCYLDLWKTPANADSVTWNDGNCNYHSKSYYCQSVKFSSTPKTGSPTGCTCKKVELNGRYSVRFLLKCENCLDVRRSKEKNSCPLGTKIFSPQTREDWKTFIASATSLRSPHWIIDVTRPQNGCGGCTKNSMHSGTAAQGTWKTADMSPWWLRKTTYNEPNGDYHANCYLDLWHAPANENSVTFNDGNCNYHSKSYYCQTVKSKKSGKTTTHPPWKIKDSWKLVMKLNGDATFGFSSKYWTDDKTLNDSADEAAPGNAKYAEFLSVPFGKIKMCVGSPDKNCVEHKFTRDYANAKALFSAGYIRDGNLDQKNILKTFGPAKGAYQECPPQRPGFNIECNDGNKARWGYCTNCASQPCQNADGNDADAAIGIGLAGQSTPRQMGAGWTNYFASGKGTCSANSMTSKQIWFYVFKNIML